MAEVFNLFYVVNKQLLLLGVITDSRSWNQEVSSLTILPVADNLLMLSKYSAYDV